ncbi:condensin complex subunit 2/barren [Kickxella alabastrina]|uniref:condensin complex subunit 2/barren n=1 Tax=Kickxella alabastrina TaxID=61397 RepID=UPI00222012D7|nr:condensin complex subunit 2/barren [Kickxella alabastrina]KAI7829046.1 condensin complex subunit 2/barren [Kickxella alabastrina]
MFTPKQSNGRPEITSPQSVGTPQTPRVNDDAAERRRRRKSAIERRRSNLVTPHRLTTKSPQLTSPGPFAVQLPRLSPEELNQRYEEWMKIAADNKINANNTWDFALIDYFYDMSLLRDGDSINFQKASCTLDGCVKIYSSRVDSVASETGRLLSGLADAPGKRSGRRDEGNEDGEDGDEEESSGKQKSRRAARSSKTLAKDFASISFSVDPLFKKTSADFDEGGARGLLLNHLAFDADGKIVFDASDSKTLAENDDEAMEDVMDELEGDAEDGVPKRARRVAAPVGSSSRHKASLIDISSMDDVFDNIMLHLDEAEICPSLADFEFTRDTHGCDDHHHGGFGDDGDDMGHFLNFDETDSGPMPLETASTLQMAELRETEELHQQKQGDLQAILHEAGQLALAVADDEDNLLSYFDSKLSKSWAGPEHWRLPISRAAMHKQMHPQHVAGKDGELDRAEDAEASKRKRVEKQAYFTDFMNSSDVSAEMLFVKPARASAAMNQEHTLPEDVHFTSKNLFNLILKPRLKFNPRRMRAMAAIAAASSAGSGYAEGTQGSGGDSYGGFVVDGDDSGNIFGAMNDDGPLGGMDDGHVGFDDVDDYDDDVLPLQESVGSADNKPDIPLLKLIKPLYVNYARRAKRVNVKKLKDNIWREMAAGDRRKSMAADDAAMLLSDGDEVKLESDQRFSEIVSNLKNVYPREKLEELSISYCFICLLHLANERNLRIVGDSSLRDLVITQDHFD